MLGTAKPTLTKGFDENASGPLCYYIWLLNNNLEYFFHSRGPFLTIGSIISKCFEVPAKTFR